LVQLFQSLLSNAIKFHKPATHPVIFIRCFQVNDTEIPTHVKPARPSRSYFRVDVTDQGIGFDDIYVDRIFQVFQRLHIKSIYPGTGIGLAICEKIAVNHGGAITAFSSPGNGATFSIFFPVMD
jgi:signal transduction histidine kinase